MVVALAASGMCAASDLGASDASRVFAGAKWIGSHAALLPKIDFSRARWICGERVSTRFVHPADGFCECRIAAKKPFEVRMNGVTVFRWTGSVYRPEIVRSVNLTPFLRVGENELTLLGGEAFLAVVRTASNELAATSARWQGVSSALEKAPSFAGRLNDREEIASPAFARRFVVRRELVRATLAVTGLGFYEARLDGRKIGDRVLDPSPTDYDRRVLYSTYDLGVLAPGEHELGILLGHGWYDMRTAATWNFDSAPWRDFPKALARLTLVYRDGSQEDVVSDSSWSQVESPIAYDCIREGEIVDARRKFGRPTGLKAAEVAPPRGVLEPVRHPPARIVEELAPQKIVKFGADRFLVTFPRTIAGWVRVSFRGLAAGSIVTLRYDENLDADGNPAVASQGSVNQGRKPGHRSLDVFFGQSGSGRIVPSGSAAQTDHFISAGEGVETFEPRFVYHGFRHVLVEGVAEDLKAADIRACRVMTDFKSTGSFACSDAKLTELVELARNSYRANFADGVPTDCPHREKLGWTGDGWIASEVGLSYFDTASSYRKWLQDILDTARASGEICCIAPTSGWGCPWGLGPVFDAAVGMIAWNLWMFCGDRAAIETAYPALVRYLAFEHARASLEGLVANGLGDWNALHYDDRPADEFVISSIYLMLEETAARMADALGKKEDARRHQSAAERTRAALRRKYACGAGVYANGGQTAQALALMCALPVGARETKAAADRLVQSVLKTDCHLDFGLVGSKFVYRALSQIGRTDLAYRMIVNPTEPSMTKWLGQNGTLWEDYGNGYSKCHIMLGDFAAWAQQYVAGIRRPEKPGYAKVLVAPCPVGGLAWAKGCVRTPRGELASSWRIEKGEMILEVTIPPATEAEVRLPDGTRHAIAPGRSTLRCKTSVAVETSRM